MSEPIKLPEGDKVYRMILARSKQIEREDMGENCPDCGKFIRGDTLHLHAGTKDCLRNQLTKLQSENERRKQFFRGARIETESILGHFYMYYRWKIVLPVGVEISINHYGWKSTEEAEEAARQFMGVQEAQP